MIKLKALLPWLIPALLVPLAFSAADWVALDASGNAISFEGVLSPSGANLPKHVITDTTGLNVVDVGGDGSVKIDTGGATLPVSQSGTWDVGLINPIPLGSNTIGGVSQAGGPWAYNLTQINGVPPSPTNPLPAQLVHNGSGTLAVVSASNALPATCISGCGTAGVVESAPATYSAADSWVESAAAGDRACLWGSATRLIRLKRLSVNAYNGAPATSAYRLTKRSSANTGGTPATIPAVIYDTTDPVATASVTEYTGTDTPGTSAGDLVAFSVYPNGAGAIQQFTFGAVERGDKSVTLRGTSEGLCLFGVSATSNFLYVVFEWTEE
jgi:hypothetical protein